MKYDEAFEEIPYLQFDRRWKVKIIPPFNGATCRFTVEYKGVSISVFLDCNQALGYYNDDRGYWEIYPGTNQYGDPDRFGFDDTDGLIAGIRKSLKLNRRNR